MKIQPVKGTRDFYPPVMAVRNYIVDGWKSASLRNGFEEYDGPIFEYLQMYQVKSGEEIEEQLFNFTDRGDRRLAIRPEITPTLARMVNQQINTLPRPIKWFSTPRLCRAERPQKGRLREFFQWNIDIIGVEDCVADAEVIFCALDYLRQAGLTADDIVVRISSRKLLAETLKAAGVSEDKLDPLYALLDKKAKLPAEAFDEMLTEQVSDEACRERIQSIMAAETPEQIGEAVEMTDAAKEALDELQRCFSFLESMGVAEFCCFDINIVRGLAYYTGIVFEVYDRGAQLRAIGGGGRYDNLLKLFGGPSVTATGFGMGDCVLGILLEEKGLIEKYLPQRSVEYYIACADEKYFNKAIAIAAALRRSGRSASFSYKTGKLGKQLKQASAENAQRCVIVGEELEGGEIVVKDMAEGSQDVVELDVFLDANAADGV